MQPRQGAPACAASRRHDQAARMHVGRALARFHDSLGLHHRLAEVLESSEAIPFTGDARDDPHARAAVPGQAEAVITSRTGL